MPASMDSDTGRKAFPDLFPNKNQFRTLINKFPRWWYCYSHVFWETDSLRRTITQKDNADGEVQFIMPVGPRQSLLLAKDPVQHL